MPIAGVADNWVTVLRLDAALGGVTLLGRRATSSGGVWEFRLESIDQSAELLEDECSQGAAGVASQTSEVVVTAWGAALALLDRYPWALLHPRQIHPMFVERVKVAVEERLERDPRRELVGRARKGWKMLLVA